MVLINKIMGVLLLLSAVTGFAGISNDYDEVHFRSTKLVMPTWYDSQYFPGQSHSASELYSHFAYYGMHWGLAPSPAFDPAWYFNNNPDIVIPEGVNQWPIIVAHFYDVGMKQCRSGSAEFNPIIYLGNYLDLQQAIGSDCSKAYRHYVEYGYDEGRTADYNFAHPI